jgi:hypothetical protein
MFNPGYRIQPGSLFACDLYRLRVICAEPASTPGKSPAGIRRCFACLCFACLCFAFRCFAVLPPELPARPQGPASPDFPRDISGDTPERKYFDPIDRAPKRRPNCA